jgi:hypothetical protein
MYHLHAYNRESGNAISYTGSLVQCYRMAKRCVFRLGMTATVTRSDGTTLNQQRRRPNLPKRFQ